MELFMKHPGKVFTKQQIYEQGWGDTYVVADNNIMVCISKLRAKLDEDPAAIFEPSADWAIDWRNSNA